MTNQRPSTIQPRGGIGDSTTGEIKISPRIDEKTGVGWCSDSCSEYRDPICKCVDDLSSLELGEVCPVWARRQVERVKELEAILDKHVEHHKESWSTELMLVGWEDTDETNI